MLIPGIIGLDNSVVTAEAMPSGENQEGKTFSWVPSSSKFDLRHPKIAFGPSSLSSNTGIGTSWTALYGSIGAHGMRSELVSYTPKGRWCIPCGFVTVATTTPNSVITVRVMQGTTESDPTNQPHIWVGSPVQVGQGQATAPQVANVPFQVTFIAPDIQCPLDPDWACQIWIEAKASASGATALGSNGDAIQYMTSWYNIMRMDGLYG